MQKDQMKHLRGSSKYQCWVQAQGRDYALDPTPSWRQDPRGQPQLNRTLPFPKVSCFSVPGNASEMSIVGHPPSFPLCESCSSSNIFYILKEYILWQP